MGETAVGVVGAFEYFDHTLIPGFEPEAGRC